MWQRLKVKVTSHNLYLMCNRSDRAMVNLENTWKFCQVIFTQIQGKIKVLLHSVVNINRGIFRGKPDFIRKDYTHFICTIQSLISWNFNISHLNYYKTMFKKGNLIAASRLSPFLEVSSSTHRLVEERHQVGFQGFSSQHLLR